MRNCARYTEGASSYYAPRHTHRRPCHPREGGSMLTTEQRERIRAHLQHGWKLPDSLVQELWEAYVALERALLAAGHPDARHLEALGPEPEALAVSDLDDTRR